MRPGQHIDRLIANAKIENGTTREDHSHAAPDQHISEEIIVADTASSIGRAATEGAGESAIMRLALIREVAFQQSVASDETGDESLIDSRHWNRTLMALTDAIACHVPTSLSDVLLVLDAVATMRDLVAMSDASEEERRRCSEATAIAMMNCLPVMSDHASDVARHLSREMTDLARRRISIREGRRHG